jgi:hypothetical protein
MHIHPIRPNPTNKHESLEESSKPNHKTVTIFFPIFLGLLRYDTMSQYTATVHESKMRCYMI